MGKIAVITREQELLLDEFRNDPTLTSRFYFSGGTALSLYYLQHRQSVDMDFFSEEPFDPQVILHKVTAWADNFKASVEYVPIEDTHIFNIIFPNQQTVKVDFALYPYKRVKESKNFSGVSVDSTLDIAINKLITIQQRSEIKDFVDLFFLLQKFAIWDLIEGVKTKFHVKLDLFIVGSNFLKVDEFNFLPKMVVPLKIESVQEFYHNLAKKLGLEITND